MSSNKSFSNETADRYARAMFEIAQESKNIQMIESNAKDLLQVYNQDKNFENFITNPTQSSIIQTQVINKISEKMNFLPIFKNFLSILVFKRRIFFLKKIIITLLKMILSQRGEVSAKLISSKKLTEQELKSISLELSNVLGSSVNFDYRVDEELIGGFKMQIGSTMIDTSIKNKLKKYEQLMLEI